MDNTILATLMKHRTRLVVIGFGIMYLWFGTLKLFPGLSPAESLAKATLDKLTFGLVPSNISYLLLAIWEISIGVAMLFNFVRREVIFLTMLHLLFTFTPLFLLPDVSWQHHFFTLSLVGQYIIKNIALLFGLLFILPDLNVASKAG